MKLFNRIFGSKGSKPAHRRAVRFRPGLQQLETRWAPAVFHWVGGTNENFWEPTNWQEQVAPPNNGSADIYINSGGVGTFPPKSTAVGVDINSLHMTISSTALILDRSALTLRNGGALTIGSRIYTEDSTGGDDIRGITLAGGTFAWSNGIINPSNKWGQPFSVQQGATLHITTPNSPRYDIVKLGTTLQNNGGTINIVGSPGGTFTFGNGQGLVNSAGTVTISYNVTLTRSQGGAPSFNNAFINNYHGATITWRDGTITSALPVDNAGTFHVAAQTQAVAVTIHYASPSTSNVGMHQISGLTLIDADAANATLTVNEGYKGLGGSLVGRASGTGFTPKLATVNGNITLSGGSSLSAMHVGVGDLTHVNTTFVMSSTQVTIGPHSGVDWYWQNGPYSKLDVQGALSISDDDTHAGMTNVAGSTPSDGAVATVLTSTGTFTGTFGTALSPYIGGSWTGAADNPQKKFVFTWTTT